MCHLFEPQIDTWLVKSCNQKKKCVKENTDNIDEAIDYMSLFNKNPMITYQTDVSLFR